MPITISGDTGLSGNSGALIAATAQASTSGTSIEFTSIPSWAKRVTIMGTGISLSGTDQLRVQLGTASSYETSSYVGGVFQSGNSATFSTGFDFNVDAPTAATTQQIYLQLALLDASTNTWAAFGGSSGHKPTSLTGSKALAGALTRVRVVATGSNTFDAGTINIHYE